MTTPWHVEAAEWLDDTAALSGSTTERLLRAALAERERLLECIECAAAERERMTKEFHASLEQLLAERDAALAKLAEAEFNLGLTKAAMSVEIDKAIAAEARAEAAEAKLVEATNVFSVEVDFLASKLAAAEARIADLAAALATEGWIDATEDEWCRLRTRVRELEDVVKACRSTCKYAQDADANSPDQTARYYGRFRAQAAAAERAAIVAWMKQRNEDIDRPGLDGAIWAREIERAHHLTEAQRTTDACRFNDCPPKDCADCDEHRLQRERAAGNFEAQLLADSTDPKRTAEGG